MSFDQLIDTSKTLKKKDFAIKKGDKTYKFSAHELSYTKKLKLAGVEASGGDAILNWIVLAIRDEDGKSMTLEQAEQLPDEVKERFVEEVFSLNSEPAPKAKKKSKRK